MTVSGNVKMPYGVECAIIMTEKNTLEVAE